MDDADGVPEAPWREVALAEHRLLMLDYDGTLAPFHVVRDDAVPWPRSLELLRAITAGAHTSVGIVSGRPLEELIQLLGPLHAVFVGEHGWEHRDPDGRIVRAAVPAAIQAQLDAAEGSARALGWGEQLERKRAGLVLHTRGRPPGQARDMIARCAQAWLEPASHPGLRLDRIDGGLELRACGHDKGTAADWLLSRHVPGTLGVFVGDDLTDEDAFEVVSDRGFGVRVGGDAHGSLARAWLPSYKAVPGFLAHWLEVTERGHEGGHEGGEARGHEGGRRA